MNRSSYPSSKRSAKARPANDWNYREEDDDEEEEDDDELELPESNDDEEEDYAGYQRAVESNYRSRSSKMRKVEDFNSSYEFRPRGIHGARASHPEWNDHSTYVLLDTWGERFLQLGRSSLRSDDWSEVAERVSELTGSEFSVSDCRSRLNDLKNKYKKEKAKSGGLGGRTSKWIYCKKMDMLLTMPPRQQQQCGLACGVDSGEFVFMNPRVYLDHSNALDEMRDSPGNSDSEEDDDDGDGYRRGRGLSGGDDAYDLGSYRMLSESIKRVGEVYENIENSKREHMMDLERMRMEFQRDLEMQKKEMMETTRAEIERIRRAEAEDEDADLEDGDGSAHGASE